MEVIPVIENPSRSRRGSFYRLGSILIGVLVNVALSYAAYRFGLPLYLDTIGTIAVTAMGGLLPGLITAVISNMCCAVFNNLSIYYVLISILIALFTSWFTRTDKLKKKSLFPVYLVVLALLGGGLGLLFQYMLLGHPQFEDIEQAAETLSETTGLGVFSCALIMNVGLNLVDKAISAGIAFLILRILPEKLKKTIRYAGWKQTPLSREELKEYRNGKRLQGVSLKKKFTILLIIAVASISAALAASVLTFYYRTTEQKYRENAVNAARFIAETVDGDQVSLYLKDGCIIDEYENEDYVQTLTILKSYIKNSVGIEYMYVYQIREDGCRLVFDTDPEVTETDTVGSIIPIDESFRPYLPDLLQGRKMPVIESDDTYGHLITAYEPIYDSKGRCVAYAGADASMELLDSAIRSFLFRMVLIFAGFIILILAAGMRLAEYNIIFPIKSLAGSANVFNSDIMDQKTLDENVRAIRSIDIHTNDEMEDLYTAMCRMSAAMAEQMRDLRHYAETTSKMQNGLIITMADMVESRDSDTGAHVQKTAAYVRIILEGLKKKGYYPEKITPAYIAEVEMSAPLHDVGKINIPDAILNKPGKLNPDEYEIMKTHTTAGKNIIEKCINTVHAEAYLKEARNMAGYHHERWDGKGYPEGLHGEVIPLSARVMAVADVFDALTSPRVYKPAFPVDRALDMISEGAGTQFDPKVVEAFMDSLPDVKAVLKKFHNI